MIEKRKLSRWSEQRRVKRAPFVASVEVLEPSSGTKLSARVSELGVGGCYVDAMNPFPEGTNVTVRILRDLGLFEAKARVVYAHPACGMGVAFTEIAKDQRLVLEEWLAEIVQQLKPVG